MRTVEIGRFNLDVSEVTINDAREGRAVLVLSDDAARWEVEDDIADDVIRRWRAGEKTIPVRVTYTIDLKDGPAVDEEGSCETCGTPYQLVRPGKSQPNCACDAPPPGSEE